MSIEQHFTASTAIPVLGESETTLTEPDNFRYNGAVDETATEFTEYTQASRIIDEAGLSHEQMHALATLMNRAVAYGRHLVHLENPELNRD